MSGAATSKATQDTKTDPWGPQVPYLTQGFADAQGALNTANANGVAPTGFVAGATPDQLNTFKGMLNYAGTNGNPAAEGAAGGALTGAGVNATTGALNGLGNYDPTATNNTNATIAGAKQYAGGLDIPGAVRAAMQPAIETARDVTMPGIASNAAGTGNVNSSRTGIAEGLVERGLAENAQNLNATLTNDAYSKGADLASNTNSTNNAATLAALSGAAGAGTSAAGTGLGALSGAVGDQSKLFDIANAGGAGQQAANQSTFDNQKQAYDFSQNSPFAALQQYMGLIQGNYGGTSNTSSTSTPSAMSVIGSLLGAGGSAIGSKAGAFGGGSGLLGLLA